MESDILNFLNGTIISGIMYDYFKAGIKLTAKNIKDFFQENLYDLPNEQARVIFAKTQDIPTSSFNMSKDDFISQYTNHFEPNIENILKNQTNIGNKNTNIMANGSGNTFNFNQNIQKKTVNYSN